MTFKKGSSGNPSGRPSGSISPLTRAKTMILKIFEDNPKLFEDKLREEYEKTPIDYYLKFISPFMPKEMNIEATIEQKNERPTIEAVTSRLNEISNPKQKNINSPKK